MELFKSRSRVVSVGFTGTRDGMTGEQLDQLMKCLIRHMHDGETELSGKYAYDFHHGDCVGADEEAAAIAGVTHGWRVSHPPIDTKLRAYTKSEVTLPPLEYKERNKAIVRASQVVIVAPGTEKEIFRSGTWQTVRFARKYKRPLTIIYPSGRVEIEPGDST